eukprot:scaffold9206_cov113-Isochrysis_galbana.AAC.6
MFCCCPPELPLTSAVRRGSSPRTTLILYNWHISVLLFWFSLHRSSHTQKTVARERWPTPPRERDTCRRRPEPRASRAGGGARWHTTLELGDHLVPRGVRLLVLAAAATPRALVPSPLHLPTARAVAWELGVRAVRDVKDGAHLFRDGPMVRGSFGSIDGLHVAQESCEGVLVPLGVRVLERLHGGLGGPLLSVRSTLDRREALRQVAHSRVARARGVQHERSLLQPLRNNLRSFARQ